MGGGWAEGNLNLWITLLSAHKRGIAMLVTGHFTSWPQTRTTNHLTNRCTRLSRTAPNEKKIPQPSFLHFYVVLYTTLL